MKSKPNKTKRPKPIRCSEWLGAAAIILGTVFVCAVVPMPNPLAIMIGYLVGSGVFVWVDL